MTESNATPMTETEFLARANGRARTRLFAPHHYEHFCAAFARATEAAAKNEPYYETDDMGGVANGYGSTTTTAQWGVYVHPRTGLVEYTVGRVRISGRHVPCCYHGGEQSYDKTWRETHQPQPA